MRPGDVLFSVLLHATLATAVLAWPGTSEPLPPKVYEVTLAEFAGGPQAAAPAPPQETPEPPRPAPPPPKPQPKPQPKKEKAISARKEATAKPAPQEPQPEEPQPQAETPAQEAPPSSAPAQAAGGSGHGPRNVGGFLAYDSDKVDTRPSVLRRVVPEYPAQARRLHQEGRVLVRLVVDEQGQPQACSVQEAEPPEVFDEASLRAVRRFRFVPGRKDGRFVATLVLIPFVFTLR